MADLGLALAVIAHAAGLQHQRQADGGGGRAEVGDIRHRPVGRSPDAARAAEILFEQAILADAEHLGARADRHQSGRSEEHTSELQSLMRNSYAVFCLKKKKQIKMKQ